MNKASFSQRFIAWSIDQIILSIIYTLAAFAVGGISGLLTKNNIQVPSFILSLLPSVGGIILAPVLGHFLYFGYFWSRRERSIGMGIMNIKVVNTDGRSLSFLMAGLRGTFGYFISGLVFGLGYLWFFVGKEQETWHDKIFNTVVVE
jgi:uncharacterized RDD family membrane protein YckC